MISLFSEFIYLWYWFTSRQIELCNMYYVFIWIKDGKRSWPILHKIIFFSGLGPGYKPSLHLQSCESDVSEIDGWTPWSRNSKPRKLWHFFVTFGAQYLGPLKMSLASHHSGTRNHYFFSEQLEIMAVSIQTLTERALWGLDGKNKASEQGHLLPVLSKVKTSPLIFGSHHNAQTIW